MNQRIHHTIRFDHNSQLYLRTSRPQLNRLQVPFINSQKINVKNSLKMLDNAVGKIYQVLRYIERSGPYIDKYGPIIKEMPTMYKLMKAFNEIEQDATSHSPEETPLLNDDLDQHKQSRPKLYI